MHRTRASADRIPRTTAEEPWTCSSATSSPVKLPRALSNHTMMPRSRISPVSRTSESHWDVPLECLRVKARCRVGSKARVSRAPGPENAHDRHPSATLGGRQRENCVAENSPFYEGKEGRASRSDSEQKKRASQPRPSRDSRALSESCVSRCRCVISMPQPPSIALVLRCSSSSRPIFFNPSSHLRTTWYPSRAGGRGPNSLVKID